MAHSGIGPYSKLHCHHGNKHTHQKHIGQDGLHGEGCHGDALLGVLGQQRAVPHGGGGDVDDPLDQKTSLRVEEDDLTPETAETPGHLHVHRQLQADRQVRERETGERETDRSEREMGERETAQRKREGQVRER